MPVYANTPEALLGRSDSKNPSTTCRGITSGGRPCRRSITTASAAVTAPLPAQGDKIRAAKLRVDDPRDQRLYCWQHKEQASLSARSSPGPRCSHVPIREEGERTSLDTLADRLGLVAHAHRGAEQTRKSKPDARPTRPGGRPAPAQPPTAALRWCCCLVVPRKSVAASPAARPRPRPVHSHGPSTPTKTTSGVPSGVSSGKRRSKKPQSQPQLAPLASSPHYSDHSPTQSTLLPTAASYLSLIPSTASPQTASLLMSELVKPISPQDEAGYIYMFWLTPTTQPATPPVDAARSLLVPPIRPASGQRRPSHVFASFAAMLDANAESSPWSPARGVRSTGSRAASKGGASPASSRILLKIGRATNVQRRLNEWQRQCGYNLSLIRYYPYVPSSSSSLSSSLSSSGSVVPTPTTPRKMPHSHKVERLIHMELAGRGLRVADGNKCAACGREHREWFEVEASRAAVGEVDDVIRRWVDWGEQQRGQK